ncbi:hypothetical protein EJ05DRAFT_488186 [Pseudovirgaria hyperparasitica]|uniref:Zn(2)-C6 fungal-type domain-containing protein n=1 Tax=Pseudovirgaria hyperparasitica TaxID=470096 RepID=A0A6A6VYW0_9PEZI|nr:uncharacterized protein EJ05DRAFT_488186 [Pseudovirgaria hyperparasitica]KAF2755415.1 hypothetical protein EJ05DRAFT_488186 [Pseudovirgaria hyperparasitica]
MSGRVRSIETEHQCQKCKKFFSQKSSLTRHTKRCVLDLPVPIRQKSCSHCANAKARCNLRRPSCSRCTARELPCSYPTSASERSPSPTSSSSSKTPSEYPVPSIEDHHIALPTAQPKQPNDSSIDTVIQRSSPLLPSSALPSLRDQSLLYPVARLPSPTPLTLHSTTQIFLVHRSWVGTMASKTHLPPIIHPRQIPDGIPLDLMGFYLVAKVWTSATAATRPGVTRIAEREMLKFHERYTAGQVGSVRDMVIDLQVFLLYAIIKLFPPDEVVERDVAKEREIFAHLQDVAYQVAKTGLFLPESPHESGEAEDELGDLPSWDTWLLTEAKRRAIIAVYQMAWAWSVRHSFPVFHGRELDFVQAPAAKTLWEAENEEKFAGAWRLDRRKWGAKPYLMGELPWLAMPGNAERDRRTEMWAEDVDDFGMFVLGLRE